MALNSYDTLGSASRQALSRRAWSDILHKKVQDKLVLKKMGFIGPDQGDEDGIEDVNAYYPIIQKTELGKDGGDRITLPMLNQLSGAGISGNNALKGSEEQMNFQSFDVYIEMLRNATGFTYKMSKNRNKFHAKNKISDLLADWMAQKMDNSFFDAMYRGYSAHVIANYTALSAVAHPNLFIQDGANFFAYGVSNGGTVMDYRSMTSSDSFSTATLEAMATWAEDNNINPCRMDNGEEGIIAIVHPYQLQQLRQDADWVASNRLAGVRGMENAIFSRAEGMYAGVYVHTTKKVESVTDETDGVTSVANGASVRLAVCLGAHSIARALGQKPEMVKRDDTDYGQIEAYGMDSIWGDSRADWVSDDGSSTKTNQSSSVWGTYSANPITLT